MTVPVPLTDIEAAAADFDADTGPEDVLALCEALRIAVEGLAECGRHDAPAVPGGYRHRAALAAVRELVDLGGDE